MDHSIHKVTGFEVVGPYSLRVSFEDRVTRTIDFSSILNGELFGPLRNLKVFEAVSLDPEVHTLVWPNGADFDPTTLHDWPEHEAAMKKMACGWLAG